MSKAPRDYGSFEAYRAAVESGEHFNRQAPQQPKGDLSYGQIKAQEAQKQQPKPDNKLSFDTVMSWFEKPTQERKTYTGASKSIADKRDELVSQLEHEEALAGFISTVEQEEEHRRKIADLSSQISDIDVQLGNAPKAYVSSDRADAVMNSWGDKTAAAYLNAVGNVQENKARYNVSADETAYNSFTPEQQAEYDRLIKQRQQLEDSRAYVSTVEQSDELERQWQEINRQIEALGVAPDMNKANTTYAKADEHTEKYTSEFARAKEGQSKAEQAIIDLTHRGLDVAADAAASLITGGIGGRANMLVRSYGAAAGEARANGDPANVAMGKGITAGLIELGSEMLGGGFGKVYGASVISKAVDKAVKSPIVKGIISSLGEGLEEGVASVLQFMANQLFGWGGSREGNYIQRVLNDANANKEEIIYEMALGAIIGVFGSGQKIQDSTTSLTQSDMEMPKSGNKITAEPATNYIPVVDELISSGKVSNTEANNIKSNPGLANAFYELTGISLENLTTEEARKTVQGEARTRAYAAQQSEQAARMAAAEAEAEQNAANLQAAQDRAAQAQTELEEAQALAVQNSGYSSYVRGLYLDGMTPAKAGEIFRNPKLKNAWETMTGITLPESKNSAVDIIIKTPLSDAALPDPLAAKLPQSASGGAGDIQIPPTTASASTAPNKALNTQTQLTDAADILVQMATGQKNTVVPQQNVDSAAQPGENVNPPAESGRGAERVRGYEQNVATSTVTDPELKARVEESLQKYRQLGNRDTLKAAQDIMSKGLPAAQAELQQAIGNAKQGGKLAPEMVPLSRLVANELTRNGDVATARQIIADVAVELTAAGQLGQAGRIMRTADPATALDAIRKALDKINAEFAQNMPHTQWKAELTKADEQLIADTDFTQEGAFEQVYEQIARRIGAEMPVSMWKKAQELRRINMLLRPRTVIKNVVGNMPMMGLRKGAERLSAEIQKALPEEMRTRGVANDNQKLLAREYFAEHRKDLLEQGDRWDMNSLVRKYTTVFKGKQDNVLTKALSKLTGEEQQNVMEGLRQLTYKALETGDAPFMESAFVDSLSQYLAAQGIDSAEGITQEAVDFAMANAMEATFKNVSVLSTALNNIKRNANPAVATALDVLFPFTTTPINIFAQTVKYSPIGLANGVFEIVTQGANASNIDALSKGAVGSAVLALGWVLRSLGLITGGEDEDKDKAALDKATGNNAYSIGGKWSYDWAQPVGSLLALGAEMSDAISEQESWATAGMNALYTAGDSVLNLSIFQNVISALKGTGTPAKQIADAIIEGGATQLIPGLAGDIAKLIDGTVRSTYTGGNVFDDAAAKMQASIPGLSKNLPASVNVKGEANTRGNLAERFVNILINPGTWAQGERSAADEEVYRVYEETGSKTHFPSVSPYKFDYDGETYKLSPKEREQFQTTQGQTYQDVVSKLLETAAYKNATASQQQNILDTVRDYSLALAKDEYIEAKGQDYEWGNKSLELGSKLSDPAQFLADTAIAKANAKKKGEEFSANGKDAFSYYAEKSYSAKDLDVMADKMLGDRQNAAYDAFRVGKVKPKEIMGLFEQMDGDKKDGKYNQKDVFAVLFPLDIPETQKAIIWDNTQTGSTDWASYLAKNAR